MENIIFTGGKQAWGKRFSYPVTCHGFAKDPKKSPFSWCDFNVLFEERFVPGM